MLKETYHNPYKGWGEQPPADVVVIHVMRNHGHVLSPSRKLLNYYQLKRISWDQFVFRFREEMNNDFCKSVMKVIKERSKEVDVYLVCACYNKEKRCHRFILMDMIEKMD